jgi:hypothetical protein
MPDMQFPRRSIARQNDIFHNSLLSFRYIKPSVFSHTVRMKKLALTVTAFLFVCAVSLSIIFTTTHTKRAKQAPVPVYARYFKR